MDKALLLEEIYKILDDEPDREYAKLKIQDLFANNLAFNLIPIEQKDILIQNFHKSLRLNGLVNGELILSEPIKLVQAGSKVYQII